MKSAFRGVVKKRSFYGQADRKGLTPPPYGQGVVIISKKLTYVDLSYHWTKIFTFAYSQGRGADPTPYGQPDRKKTVFFDDFP